MFLDAGCGEAKFRGAVPEGVRYLGVDITLGAAPEYAGWSHRPDLVAEVRYEHATGGRFRGVSRLSRWRPDREPSSCHISQLDHGVPDEIREIFGR